MHCETLVMLLLNALAVASSLSTFSIPIIPDLQLSQQHARVVHTVLCQWGIVCPKVNIMVLHACWHDNLGLLLSEVDEIPSCKGLAIGPSYVLCCV